VGDEAGTAAFTVVMSLNSRSGLSKSLDLSVKAPTQERDVSVVRLDDALPAAYQPSFIKIDVEGGEFAVLRGARRTIRAQRPIVAFEHQAASRFDVQLSSNVFQEVADLGLTLRSLAGHVLDKAEFLEAVERRREWNFVGTPG
jgi:hypothetical protein